jgi:hypothetical protein
VEVKFRPSQLFVLTLGILSPQGKEGRVKRGRGKRRRAPVKWGKETGNS